MKNETKYPYIGECVNGVALFSSKGVGAALKKENAAWSFLSNFEFTGCWFESDFKNITHEYLQNTWGVVESKEHAEFIIELAKNAGFDISDYNENRDSYFYTDDDYIGFTDSEELAGNRDEKQITIPLPPKNDVTRAELVNLISALRDEKSNIWPQVGDKVVFPSGNGILAISKPDDNGVVIVECNDKDYGRVYKRVALSALTKPKSPQDLLIEELQTKLCENNYTDNYTLANDIVNGMIEGLVYSRGEK
ncbi:hypothetical protein MAELSTROM_64 [Pseudoalteromonas phage Maelstrom]|uniref:hypothetical protein n=1 Tax=Pseudoalteromonas phage Maelstrom TaxID=2065202 RepID=UPI000CA0AD79|nr:hypothetical protein PP584_gp64 [Pseudoalteromonas phage Maelstrom]AUG84983.1 hypothetical protein MAELSTROM_64 [Pseudoalteromonas phage Maelstrom]